MTCPIRLPTADELNTLQVHWLTADAPWDPTEISEPLDTQVIVPLGYTSTLGTMNLVDLDLDLGDLGGGMIHSMPIYEILILTNFS